MVNSLFSFKIVLLDRIDQERMPRTTQRTK